MHTAKKCGRSPPMVVFRITWKQVPVTMLYVKPRVAVEKSKKDRSHNCARVKVAMGTVAETMPAHAEEKIGLT